MILPPPPPILVTKNTNFVYEKLSSVISIKNNLKGKGAAIRTGLLESKRKILVISDVGFPYELKNIASMVTMIDDNNDVVLCSRKSEYYNRLKLLRRWVSKGFCKFCKIFLGPEKAHIQAGLKVMNKNGRMIYLKTKKPGYLADFEFGLLLNKNPEIKVTSLEVDLDKEYKPSIYKGSKLLKSFQEFVSVLFAHSIKR